MSILMRSGCSRERRKASVSGAEVVERGPELEFPVSLDDALDVSEVWHPFVLGEFEHQIWMGEIGAFRGRQGF
jgi:hypothetical protein